MPSKLLVTVRSGDHARTFAFDGAQQSVLWVGLDARGSAERAVACLEAADGEMTLSSCGGALLRAGGSAAASAQALPLDGLSELIVAVTLAGGDPASIHLRPATSGMRRYRKLVFGRDVEFEIGRSRAAGFCYSSSFVSARHARVSCANGRFAITDLESANGTYVNGERLAALQPRSLACGDVVQVLDLTFAVGKGFLSVNRPPGFDAHVPGVELVSHEAIRAAWPEAAAAVGEPAPFYPAPRLSKSIRPFRLAVDDPPAMRPQEDDPLIMQVGPSFLMALSSVLMAMQSVGRIAQGADALSVAPSIAMAAAMVGGSVVWPVVSRAYRRRKLERDEARRARLYVAYLDSIENQLAAEAASQSQTLHESRRPVMELLARADELSPLLMSHTSSHADFMDLRVGVGDADIASEISWPERHFSLVDDRMLGRVSELSRNPPMLRDVPIAFDPARHSVAGILGERWRVWEFLRGLLVQLCALYSYRDVKVMMVGGGEEQVEWDFLKSLGHLYDDAGVHRFVALSAAGLVEEDLILSRELERREDLRAEELGDYGAYFVVICVDHLLAERSDVLGRLAKTRVNRGFSLIYLGRDLRDLPRECGYIIDLTPDGGVNLGITLERDDAACRQRPRSARMFERADVSGTVRYFDPDIMVTREQARSFGLGLSRARLDAAARSAALPDSVGFLELFEVGNAAHLNVGQRWAEHDASQTLEAPLGIDAQGERAAINLHERIHGPHALIAGTTGSGKSELIITYVLSLCVNYAPDEVAFVLIDYKGGGLAGAFDNERHQLPHLAGTITNLDGGAIKRSLVSIRSELRRRQDMLNKARNATGEATVDIYKYLAYYRQGVLTEPLPHLFIVADEFAELRQQEPEFMDELISAARIGRSLGVHLMLATQKPSGVVNDQIWSNSRLKVCLKVSDAQDSREMIRRDDAAEIGQAGRYHLLVGYNESFSSGQAAYAGGAYVPCDRYERRRDDAVELLDREGDPVARMRPRRPARLTEISELSAVLGQVEEAARVSGKRAARLWLDPLPARIPLDSIEQRYGPLPRTGLALVIGELDDPDTQSQGRYAVDLAELGNVLLYGSQASGVEELLQTMLLSLAQGYSARDLWIYAVDLGAGVLHCLARLPQMGGVVLAGDEERLENLVRMLEEELAERRRKLTAFGGSFEEHNRASDEPLARIVVALTNAASLAELYPDVEDRLATLTREGSRFGIHFVMTASSASSVRMRTRQNFALELPTMLNDPSDYLSILGSLGGMAPPSQERRGLTRVGKRLLEFQGACIADVGVPEDEAIGWVALASSATGSQRAPAIPQLPAVVHLGDMPGPATAQLLPVGFSKRGIAPVSFDVRRSPHMLILGEDGDAVGRYLRGLREALARADDVDYRFLDPAGVLREGDDANVLRAEADIASFVDALDAGDACPQVLVLVGMAQIVAGLPLPASQRLKDYLAQERGAGRTAIVAASEYWRVKSLYEDWYQAISSQGNGVWVGGGFSDQAVFRFARSLPEYRQGAERSDGFCVMRGSITWVRLLEAEGEP